MKRRVLIADVVILIGLPLVLFVLWRYRPAPALRATLEVSPSPPARTSEPIQAVSGESEHASTGACPNLAGQYSLQGEDGVVYYTVRQNGCERVEIDRKNNYLGEVSTEPTYAFIPDGKAHGKDIPVSHWVGDKLQIGEASEHVYYSVDSSGNLHMSDGRTYPQCEGPCDDVATRDKP
jgi:hypothetical protein